MEEKVVPGISRRDRGMVQDGEVTDPREHQILQDGSCGRTSTDDQDARGFQSRLACGRPESVNVRQDSSGFRNWPNESYLS